MNMKKIYSLFLTVVCLFIGFPSPAQDLHAWNAFEHPEKIYMFDVDITVLDNAEIQVVETITINAKREKIRLGIYRDIPTSLLESAEPLSLTMDNKPHPFFTEKKPNFLRINFGDEHFLPYGLHTYRFEYKYKGALNFNKGFDELYWNVTGNQWDFDIDQARVHITFPEQVHIQENGISVYTGTLYSRGKDAQSIAPLTYQTTRPLHPREGFTIAIPFDKGAILPPSLFSTLQQNLSPIALICLLICAALFVYFLITWLKVGKDPSYLAIVQYDPPAGISAAFTYYLYHERIDAKLISCIILDLAMKGYIEVHESRDIFKKTVLELKKLPTNDLPWEEYLFCTKLFAGKQRISLDFRSRSLFEKLCEEIKKFFKQTIKQYRITNSHYLIPPIGVALVLGVIPALVHKNPALIFVNLHFSVFFLCSTLGVHHFIGKTIFGIMFTLLYSMFWFAGQMFPSADILLCQLCFLAAMWGVAFYATLIRNVTPLGKDIFAWLAGFKKYMKTAEMQRVEVSQPLDPARVFCMYIPFAFALNLSNEWMKKFSKVLSKEVLEKCTAAVGGMHYASHISRSLSSAMPAGGRGGSGSHGGGHSGGGHGGGGGGGR